MNGYTVTVGAIKELLSIASEKLKNKYTDEYLDIKRDMDEERKKGSDKSNERIDDLELELHNLFRALALEHRKESDIFK